MFCASRNNGSGDAKDVNRPDSLARENEQFRKERVSLESVIGALQKEAEATKQELKATQEKRVAENSEFLEKFRALVEQKHVIISFSLCCKKRDTGSKCFYMSKITFRLVI